MDERLEDGRGTGAPAERGDGSGRQGGAADLDGAATAVEVTIRWGDGALHVAQLDRDGAFHVGDQVDRRGRPVGVDFVLGREVLGADRFPLVTTDDQGRVWVAVPPGAAARVDGGEPPPTPPPAGRVGAPLRLPHAGRVPLLEGGVVGFERGGLRFEVRAVRAARPLPRGRGVHGGRAGGVLGSAALFGSCLVLFALAPPTPAALSVDALDPQSRLARYAVEPRSTSPEDPRWLAARDGRGDASPDHPSPAHTADEGRAGDPSERSPADRRAATRGAADAPDPVLARARAATAGVLGALAAAVGALDGPTSPFGETTARGRDVADALGALTADTIGAAFGPGGLAMDHAGRGGGGLGAGTIGLDRLGPLGDGAGLCDGCRGAAHLTGRPARTPVVRPGNAAVVGTLGKDVVRRAIRRHLPEVRFCYERGLAARPDLEGRVAVSFLIAPGGAVQVANVHASTLGDPGVEACIRDAVRRWSFPAPGGVVSVTYPFVLQRSGG